MAISKGRPPARKKAVKKAIKKATKKVIKKAVSKKGAKKTAPKKAAPKKSGKKGRAKESGKKKMAEEKSRAPRLTSTTSTGGGPPRFVSIPERSDIIEPSRMYNYARGRQLEGTFSNDRSIGVWLNTGYRISKGWGIPPESAWPYMNEWPPLEPNHIDDLAKKWRIGAYKRVCSLNECRAALYFYSPPVISIGITEQWYDAPNGLIVNAKSHKEIIDWHVIILAGYNDNTSRFTFQNSWGSNWGDKGFGSLSYNYLKKYTTDAWNYGFIEDTVNREYGKGICIYSWTNVDRTNTQILVTEIYDADNDNLIAWAMSAIRDGIMEVNDIFVKPNFRLRGYGRTLVKECRESAKRFHVPIRFWVPWSDNEPKNLLGVRKIFKNSGIKLKRTNVWWCEAMAI